MSRLRGVLFASVLVIALGVTGCARLWSAPTPTPEPVTLHFAFSQRAKTDTYQDAATAFNLKYPHVTVEIERVNNVSRRVSSGGIDVCEVEQFDFPGLLQKNAIRDLSPILDSAANFPLYDFYPRLLDIFQIEGHTWGIPANVDPIVLFYNKDLCDQMETPYPKAGWNWDDFLLTATSLSLPDEKRYGFIPDPYGLGVWGFVYQHGGKLVDNLVHPTKATLDDPQVIEAVEWYVDLARKHQVMPELTAAAGDQWRSLFMSVWQGRVGMWMLLLSERGGRNQRRPWPFSWGVVPLPRDQDRVTFLVSSGYFITANSSSVKESWLWLKYLATEADLAWDVPPRRSVVESDAYRQRVGEEIFTIAQETSKYGMTLPSAVWLTQIPTESLNFVDDVMSGKKTAEETLREMQGVWDEAIRKMNE